MHIEFKVKKNVMANFKLKIIQIKVIIAIGFMVKYIKLNVQHI